MFKFISKQLIINMFSARNHQDSWLPWINPTRTRDRTDSFKVKFHVISTIRRKFDDTALGLVLRAGMKRRRNNDGMTNSCGRMITW